MISGDQADPLQWLSELTRRPSWHAEVACRGMGTDAFFPTKGHMPTRAIAVCADCTVVEECRVAVEVEPETPGVWAATTPMQRRAMRAGQVA